MSGAHQLIGTRLGGYEIQGLLGSGGMADVYRGFDTNLHRAVAVKVLSVTAAAEPGFADRFRQEARLLANLRHPNIVQVYDFGEQDGHTYMVQELLAGPTLAAWMSSLAARGVRPAPNEICAIVAQLAAALDVAHATGIIHRDVKPANALWNDRGELVLTDFGIAKQVVGGANQTQVGMIFGTPSYLSPEQAQCLPLTAASDVYSLGVVLYELIAGDVPFRGSTPLHVAIDHIQTPPPPLPPRPDLPYEVEALVQRALAKDPAARFAGAGELARALDRAWVQPAVPARQAKPADIHSQPTQRWQPAKSAAPVSASAGGVGGPAPAVPARPGALRVWLPRSAALPSGRPRSLLPVLGALLAVLLFGGVVLAARGGAKAANPAASTATTAATAAPAQLAAASGTPGQPGDRFAQLRKLFDNGGAARQFGPHGDKLQAELAGVRQSLAAGDRAAAVRHITAMQQILLAGAHDGTIDAGLMIEAMKQIQALAAAQGLKLPLNVEFQ